MQERQDKVVTTASTGEGGGYELCRKKIIIYLIYLQLCSIIPIAIGEYL